MENELEHIRPLRNPLLVGDWLYWLLPTLPRLRTFQTCEIFYLSSIWIDYEKSNMRRRLVIWSSVTRCQIHQHFISRFLVSRKKDPKKRKKILLTWMSFCTLGSSLVKAARKHIGEIEPCSGQTKSFEVIWGQENGHCCNSAFKMGFNFF